VLIQKFGYQNTFLISAATKLAGWLLLLLLLPLLGGGLCRGATNDDSGAGASNEEYEAVPGSAVEAQSVGDTEEGGPCVRSEGSGASLRQPLIAGAS
jgi:hypothetical protein